MTDLIHTVNRLLTKGFDLFFLPLAALDPFLSLTIFSALTGLLMVWIFGRISDQRKIRRVKDRIQANLIAVRLFQNNMGVFFRIQGRILRGTLNYLGLSLKPMLVMIVPILLILVQLHGRYAVRPLAVGEAAVVTVRVRSADLLGDAGGVRLEAGKGAVVETPPVRIPSKKEVAWRVRAQLPGKHSVTVHTGESRVEKSFVAGKSAAYVSESKVGGGPVDMLLHPAEPPLRPSSPVTSVTVGYPPLEITFLGWNVHWLLWFFMSSLASGYLLKGVLGVEV